MKSLEREKSKSATLFVQISSFRFFPSPQFAERKKRIGKQRRKVREVPSSAFCCHSNQSRSVDAKQYSEYLALEIYMYMLIVSGRLEGPPSTPSRPSEETNGVSLVTPQDPDFNSKVRNHTDRQIYM